MPLEPSLNVQRAVIIGVAAGIAALLVVELIELFIGRYAAMKGPKTVQEGSAYLGVHDATREFLNTLARTIGASDAA